MTKRRSRSLPCLIVLGLLFCLACLVTGAIIGYLPIYARSAFGPPSPDLDPAQDIYFAAILVINESSLRQPLDAHGAQGVFEVHLGETVPMITQQLQQEGYIANGDALRQYLIYAGLDTGLQAGKFNISSSMTALEIAHAMQDATPTIIDFNVLAGWRLEEIAASLPTSGLAITSDTFERIAHTHPEGYDFLQELPSGASLEGLLFPGSYQVARSIKAGGLITILLDQFKAQVSSDLIQGFRQQGLTTYQAVILASMIQREAMVKEEMPIIASVFLNRQAAGMKLDSDPTVQYALGFNKVQKTWWTNPLSPQDLQVNSPYNTYLQAGLPPGPISNPGMEALRAVAFPNQTPYYYFRAACDGSGRHTFSKTLQEHINRACP
jgi:UPF0755 protein